MKDREKIELLQKIMFDLTEARNINCTCSSFVLQYDVCGCGKQDKITAIEHTLWETLDNL